MPETRFLKVVIIFLLLLNAGTLSYLLMRHPPEGFPPDDRRGRRGAAAFLYRELQLSDAQERRYKEMRDLHHQTVETLRSRMKHQQARMYQLLAAADTTAMRSAVETCIDSIAQGQRRIEVITFEHFRDFRALCTPEQQLKFDEVISDALERL